MSNRRTPNVPIIGQPETYSREEEPNAPGLTANCEVYDSEVIEIEKVLDRLNERALGPVDYDAFDREIKERFAEIGFVVQTSWWHTNVDGVKRPDIVISDRIERKEFDYDRQVHEVVNDVLELGEGGVIKSDDSMRRLSEQHRGHKH